MLALWEVGIRNVLVTFGVEVSDYLLNFIIKLNPKKIIIAFNNDVDNGNVGNESAEKARAKICQFFDLHQVEVKLPVSKDLNKMLIDDGPDSILDWYNNTHKKSVSVVANINKNEEYDVYIGRDKKKEMHYGNPFDFQNGIGAVKVKTREEAIQNYEDWLRGDPAWHTVEPERRQWILDNLCSLEGKRLGCFCKPKACHGDVLIKLLHEQCK